MTAPDEPICGPACDPTRCMPGCALQMAVVQPVLDAKDVEIARLTMTAKVNAGLYRSAEKDVGELTKRLTADLAAALKHAHELEAETSRLREQLAGITVPGLTTTQIRALIVQQAPGAGEQMRGEP